MVLGAGRSRASRDGNRPSSAARRSPASERSKRAPIEKRGVDREIFGEEARRLRVTSRQSPRASTLKPVSSSFAKCHAPAHHRRMRRRATRHNGRGGAQLKKKNSAGETAAVRKACRNGASTHGLSSAPRARSPSLASPHQAAIIKTLAAAVAKISLRAIGCQKRPCRRASAVKADNDSHHHLCCASRRLSAPIGLAPAWQ